MSEQLVPGLTKENFFDIAYDKYPNGMKIFCDWIDDYKKNANWNNLFKEGVKYHDLPYDMQLGIWLAFMVDNSNCEWGIKSMQEFSLREDMLQYFRMLEEDMA